MATHDWPILASSGDQQNPEASRNAENPGSRRSSPIAVEPRTAVASVERTGPGSWLDSLDSGS